EVPEDAERTERRGRRDAGGERPRQPLGDHQARGAGRRPPRPRPQEPPKPKPKRLRPARRHRTAVLEELPPEHRPIAEQVLAGDIPAVRSAIEKENASRKERGEPPINGSELLALAESLRPRPPTSTRSTFVTCVRWWGPPTARHATTRPELSPRNCATRLPGASTPSMPTG